VPQEIDYPAYSVSEKNGSTTVVMSDARDSYVRYWAYFKTAYRFVFDEKSGKFDAYASAQGGKEKKLPENWFG